MFLILAVSGVSAYLLLHNGIAPTSGPVVVESPVAPSAQVTVTGLPVCLALRNPDSPQEGRCALGLRADSGEYYALDLKRLPDPLPDVSRGEPITLMGEIVPLEVGAQNQWEPYEAASLFLAASVTQSSTLVP
jgi:hypothetical protein